MDVNLKSVEGFIAGVAGSAVVLPEGIVGTGGFLFDVVGNEEVTLEAEATDHYLEDNTAVQDHISIRPAMITLKGYVGEVKDTEQGYLVNVLANVQSLGDIGGLAPNFAQQAAQAYSKVETVVSKVDNALSQANNIYQIFNQKSTTKTQAQKAFQFFENIRNSRILCRVETPFKTYKNMMLIRLGAIGPEETNTVSNFTVTFKEIRTVGTMSPVIKIATGRASDMMSPIVSKGPVVSKYVNVDLLSVTP